MDYHESHFPQLKLSSPFLLKWRWIFALIFGSTGLYGESLAAPLVAIETLHFGPEFAFSFPQPIQLGVEVFCEGGSFACESRFRYYLDAGELNLPLRGKIQALDILSAEMGVRVTPFYFPLVFSLGVGYRTLSVLGDLSSIVAGGSTIASSTRLSFSTFYLNPNLGYRFFLTDQLSLAIQVGVQVPLTGGGSMVFENSATGEDSSNSSLLSAETGAPLSRIANIIVPTVTMARLTWHFD